MWVNSHLVLASEVPWGGFKGSGYGRDLSLYALATTRAPSTSCTTTSADPVLRRRTSRRPVLALTRPAGGR
ncbi:hypothetical protein ACWC2T_13375 [Streptomyces sp. NPDC001393]